MLGGTESIVLLNKKTDPFTRQDCYIPTRFDGVAVTTKTKAEIDGAYHSKGNTAGVRIPLSCFVWYRKRYVPADGYAPLSIAEAFGRWTVGADDFFFIVDRKRDGEMRVFDTKLDDAEIADYVKRFSSNGRLYRVTEFADNTGRGPAFVRHWRIGGA